MPLNFQMRESLIEVSLHGKVTAEDFEQLFEFYRDAESRSAVTPDRITDLTDADFSALDSSDLVHFARKRKTSHLKNAVKCAIIAPNPCQFGIARMFQTYNDHPSNEIKLFKDSESACAWLGRQPNAGENQNL